MDDLVENNTNDPQAARGAMSSFEALRFAADLTGEIIEKYLVIVIN